MILNNLKNKVMQVEIDFPTSQAEAILKALQRGEKLTPLDCLNRFGSLRASCRIKDLRNLGYDIKTEIVKVGKKRVALYSLKN